MKGQIIVPNFGLLTTTQSWGLVAVFTACQLGTITCHWGNVRIFLGWSPDVHIKLLNFKKKTRDLGLLSYLFTLWNWMQSCWRCQYCPPSIYILTDDVSDISFFFALVIQPFALPYSFSCWPLLYLLCLSYFCLLTKEDQWSKADHQETWIFIISAVTD